MAPRGNKHSCWRCGTKFYDMGRILPSCPKCRTTVPNTVGADRARISARQEGQAAMRESTATAAAGGEFLRSTVHQENASQRGSARSDGRGDHEPILGNHFR